MRANKTQMKRWRRRYNTIARPLVSAPGTQQKFILNMDQTPIFLSMHSNRTLDLQGTRTVHGRKMSNLTDRVTVCLTVSAAGNKLKPFVIFKGTSDGRIVQRELPGYVEREELSLKCQVNAWQDEWNIYTYIEKVLVPYLQEKAG